MENLYNNIDKNIEVIKLAFKGSGDVVFRDFYAGEYRCFLIYIDNIVSGSVVRDDVLETLMLSAQGGRSIKEIQSNAISVGEIGEIKTFTEVFDAVLLGDTVVLGENDNVALQISTKGWPSRGIPSAVNENTLLGPKDAFTEQASTNLVLVRRRIRDINLKVKRLKVGSRSKTDISILYMEDIVRKEVLKEVEESLQALDIDAIIDAGSLSQLMEKNTFSLFPQIQLTERPDKSASALYEGRVCVLVDNSPYAILVPAPLNVFFQSPEDYYGRWLIMSFLRLMRFVAGIYAATLPAVYIALVVFHPNLIPTSLALKIAGGRAFVPFPTIIEVLIIEFAFELLREAGLRLPTPASGTIGIVGGIVIGQSAVEAGIVGPAVVIIAAFTGICNFAIPNISLVNGIRLIKFILIIATSMLGLYGFWLGVIFLIIHLASMESYSIPYLFPFCSGDADNYTDFKDSIIRIPLIFMKKRPIFASSTQRIRMGIKKEDRKK